MFVIRRKLDGKFLKKNSYHVAQYEYTDKVNRARIFLRQCDAKQAGAYAGFYVSQEGSWHSKFVPYNDATRPVYIERVIIIPESLIQ